MIRILQRKIQDEQNLLPSETPRGQARMSVTQATPMLIESETEELARFMEVLDRQLEKSNSGYFGTDMSIADLLYFWEINTIE
mmetsp:Transcript_34054/g.42032  ORF Transcript_34054/g.42032 Transcript_34054/m.42032 type:complete len:83 (-) Transcript_34054:333-581(-)